MEMQISKENPLIRKRFLHSLVVVFDMSEKQLIFVHQKMMWLCEQQTSNSESNDLHLLCFVCSLWGASKFLYMKIIIFSGFSCFS